MYMLREKIVLEKNKPKDRYSCFNKMKINLKRH